jgi:hypothetical protein
MTVMERGITLKNLTRCVIMSPLLKLLYTSANIGRKLPAFSLSQSFFSLCGRKHVVLSL